MQAHLDGDDGLAVQRIEDLYQEAAALRSSPWTISYLVAIGFDSLANDSIEMIVPDLRVQGDVVQSGTRGSNARAAVVDRIRGLIATLINESDIQRSRHTTLFFQRSQEFAAVRGMEMNATILRPMFDLEAARVLRYHRFDQAASDQLDYPSAAGRLMDNGIDANEQTFLTRLNPPPTVPRYARIATSQVLFPVGRLLKQSYRYSAERRVVAIALAIRLYRARKGHWPPNLEALTPDFLPELPRDPLVAGNPPIALVVLRGALPNGLDRPMLRFGVAAGAAHSPPPADPFFEWYVSADDVQWRDLSLWSPPPPATEPADATQAQ